MLWWIILAVLVLLAMLPLGVSVRYDEDGVIARVVAGLLRITVFPMKKKEKKPQKPKKEKKPKPAPPQAPAEEAPRQETKPEPKKPEPAKAPEKKGGSVLDFMPLVKLALDLLGDFRRKLRVDVLELKITLAGGDPCDLATNYGRAWAALGNLWPRLEELFVIKKRDVNIQCDFTSDKTLILARLDITITLGRLLWLAVRYGVKAAIEFLKISKKRKGGAESDTSQHA